MAVLTPEYWQRLESAFHDAIQLEPEARRKFLDRACAGDEELRRQVESLILSSEQTIT